MLEPNEKSNVPGALAKATIPSNKQPLLMNVVLFAFCISDNSGTYGVFFSLFIAKSWLPCKSSTSIFASIYF